MYLWLRRFSSPPYRPLLADWRPPPDCRPLTPLSVPFCADFLQPQLHDFGQMNRSAHKPSYAGRNVAFSPVVGCRCGGVESGRGVGWVVGAGVGGEKKESKWNQGQNEQRSTINWTPKTKKKLVQGLWRTRHNPPQRFSICDGLWWIRHKLWQISELGRTFRYKFRIIRHKILSFHVHMFFRHK